MRAFLAIAMPEHVAEDLAALAAHLRAGRAVAPEDLHLTLAFLGDVSLAQLDALHLGLQMLHVAPFPVRLAGLDLPDPNAPRSVYIRADGGAPLADLHARVQRAVRGAGIDLARSRFRPHVTLARFGRHPGPQAMSLLGGGGRARGCGAGAFHRGRVCALSLDFASGWGGLRNFGNLPGAPCSRVKLGLAWQHERDH